MPSIHSDGTALHPSTNPAMNVRRIRSARQSFRPGISLVEILVVIAILIVLAAVSFKVTGSLKEKASASKCMSQLREWSNAVYGYAGEHNQQVLIYRWGMVGSTDAKAYNLYLSSFDGKSVMPNGEKGISLAYYRLCPAQWRTDPNAARGYFMTHPNVLQSNGKYGKFPLIDTNGDNTGDSYPLSAISNPSEFLMMMDSTPDGATPYRTSELTTFVKPLCVNNDPKKIRHYGQVHGLFGDGHVEILNWNDINPDNSSNTEKVNRWLNIQSQ